MNIPNLLSLLRLALLPCLIFKIYHGDGIFALILLLFMALTDATDGYIARKYDKVTSLGRVLDHGVDKIVTLTLAFSLWKWRGLPSWAFYFIALREITLIVGGLYLWKKNGVKAVQSNAFGRLSGLVYTVTVAAYILDVQYKHLLLFAAVVAMTFSVLAYAAERICGLTIWGKERVSI